MSSAVDPDKLMKQAEKLALVSLTQWKPNYEGAAPLYEQAGAWLPAGWRRARP